MASLIVLLDLVPIFSNLICYKKFFEIIRFVFTNLICYKKFFEIIRFVFTNAFWRIETLGLVERKPLSNVLEMKNELCVIFIRRKLLKNEKPFSQRDSMYISIALIGLARTISKDYKADVCLSNTH